MGERFGLAPALCKLLESDNARQRIVAVDLSDEKLGLARQLGATDTFNATAGDVSAEIRGATQGGVEFAFEMAGSSRAMELAYKITRRGGSTITAGLPPPDAVLPVPLVNLVAEERTVKGSYIGTCVPRRDVRAARPRRHQRGLRSPARRPGSSPGGGPLNAPTA